MLKRILYFGSNTYVHTRKEQLLVEFKDSESKNASVPIEDIGVVILDAPQMTISRAALAKLLDNKVAVIVCNEKHMPTGMLLNLDSNSIQQEIFRNQLNASEPLKKNLWQQTVKSKILNQAKVLKHLNKDYKQLIYWAERVKSGDTDNIEGRAAAFYWKNIFNDIILNFKRRRDGVDPNNLLNYGYAILRAIVARNLSGSGLLPTLGIHHRNRYNAYALADDIMEPYRPYVDLQVRKLVEKYYDRSQIIDQLDLTPDIKQELIKISMFDIEMESEKRPLMVAVQLTTASLVDCFAKERRKIKYPTLIA